LTFQLYDYQETLVNKARKAYLDGYNAPCIVAPCGSGKSVMIAEIIRTATANKNKVLFIVHRQELIEQIEKTLIANEVDMDYVKLGMVQTIARRYKKMQRPDLIVVDENHHVLAQSYRNIINHFQTKVIGFTATPIRLNGSGLGDINDILIEEVDVDWLIEHKRLAPFDYYMPNLIDSKKLKKSSTGDFDSKSIDAALGKVIFGDVIKQYRKLADNTQAIVYCHSIEFSKTVAKEFNDAGIPAKHVDANTPKNERSEIIQEFRDKKTIVLCNVDLFGEGFDVPDCSTVILLRPTKSLSLHIQQSMRPMRYKPGKIATIIDHVGNVLIHGLPNESHEWSLEIKKKNDEGEYPIKTCENCFHVYPARAKECPMCGFKNEVIGRDGEKEIDKTVEMQKVTKEDVRLKRIVRNWKLAKSYQDLLYVAKEKGYKASWAAFKADELNLPDTPTWVHGWLAKNGGQKQKTGFKFNF